VQVKRGHFLGRISSFLIGLLGSGIFGEPWKAACPAASVSSDCAIRRLNGTGSLRRSDSIRNSCSAGPKTPNYGGPKVGILGAVRSNFALDHGRRGGIPFGRGALYYLLSNHFYIGEVKYKNEILPGEQPPIMDRALFDAVRQKSLASTLRSCSVWMFFGSELTKTSFGSIEWRFGEFAMRANGLKLSLASVIRTVRKSLADIASGPCDVCFTRKRT
jgi:hypothetical protein